MTTSIYDPNHSPWSRYNTASLKEIEWWDCLTPVSIIFPSAKTRMDHGIYTSNLLPTNFGTYFGHHYQIENIKIQALYKDLGKRIISLQFHQINFFSTQIEFELRWRRIDIKATILNTIGCVLCLQPQTCAPTPKPGFLILTHIPHQHCIAKILCIFVKPMNNKASPASTLWWETPGVKLPTH